MEITMERREQLLAGYSLESITKGDKPSWTDVRSAPKWAQDRIVAVRAALVEKRAVPDYTPTELDALHKRVLEQQARSIREAQDSGAREDAELRARLAAIGETLKREAAEAADDDDLDVCETCGQPLRSRRDDEDDDEEEEDKE
jgi:hypothetical protein